MPPKHLIICPLAKPASKEAGSVRVLEKASCSITKQSEGHPKEGKQGHWPKKHGALSGPPLTAAMKITSISQNVQGLNDPLKLHGVRHYFRRQFQGIDILCLQEHHLRGAKLRALERSFWSQATFLEKEAAVGFGYTPGDVGAGMGGICMWVGPQLGHRITESGFSQCGRAQWTRFSGLPGGDICFINVYASTSSRARCVLWEELLESLPRDTRWILGGGLELCGEAM